MAGQYGFGILITPRIGQGGTVGNHVDTLTFTNNIFEHMGSGINIGTYDDLALDASGATIPPSQLLWVHDVTVSNNLFNDLSLKYANFSHGVQIFGPPNNLVLTHNTFNFGESSNDHGWWLVGSAGLSPSNAYVTQNDFGMDLFADARSGSYATFTGAHSPVTTSETPVQPGADRSTLRQTRLIPSHPQAWARTLPG